MVRHHHWAESRFGARQSYEEYWLAHADDGAVLDGALRARLADELPVAMPSYKLAEYLRVKGGQLLDEADHVCIAVDEATGRCIGLLTARWLPRATLHLSTVLVAERYQRTVLLTRKFRLLLGNLMGRRPEAVALTTCHPTSYRCLQMFELFEGATFYPRLDGEHSAAQLREAAHYATMVAPQFPFVPATGVLVGGAGDVPADFYPSRPTTTRAAINRYFAQHVGLSDRLLCILRIEGASCWQRITTAFAVAPESSALVNRSFIS